MPSVAPVRGLYPAGGCRARCAGTRGDPDRLGSPGGCCRRWSANSGQGPWSSPLGLTNPISRKAKHATRAGSWLAVAVRSPSAMRSLLVAAVLALVSLAHDASAQDSKPVVTAAWARATPGQSKIGAAYLTIESPVADRIVSAASPVAARAEMHAHTTEGGVMT